MIGFKIYCILLFYCVLPEETNIFFPLDAHGFMPIRHFQMSEDSLTIITIPFIDAGSDEFIWVWTETNCNSTVDIMVQMPNNQSFTTSNNMRFFRIPYQFNRFDYYFRVLMIEKTDCPLDNGCIFEVHVKGSALCK